MRYFAVVSYSGERYVGFQRQPKGATIQGEIEKQLSFLLGAETTIRAAGRTDAGVHAVGQTFTFDTLNAIDTEATLKALNRLLPEDIYVRSLCVVADDFDARYSATGKVYQYVFTVNERDPLRTSKIAQLRRDDFEFEPFLRALKCFEGCHNFQNFTTKPEDGDGFIRTIESIEVTTEESGNLIRVTFRGDGFMRYQIRMILGAAMRCGFGKLRESDILEALNSTQRKIVPYKAPAEGLCLMEVIYGKADV